MAKCSATTLAGKRCKKNVIKEGFCWCHGPKEMNECGICFEETLKTSRYNVELECKHIFCKECIFKWIIEKSNSANCPKCRQKVSEFELTRAQMWGEVEGLIYRAQVHIYDLKKLSEFDTLFVGMIIDVHRETSFADSEFKLLEHGLSKDPENAKLFEKLVSTRYTVHLWIKKNMFEGNPRVFHTILP